MRRVLSVSLGSSRRDKCVVIELLGQQIEVARRGTDGDGRRFEQVLAEADGQVDVLCIGGANLALHWRGRTYPLRAIERLVRVVKRTPVVDGAGIKNSLERRVVHWLREQGLADLSAMRVLLVCAVDRFGMADELRRLGARQVVCGDLMFNVGLPLPLSFRGVDCLAPLLLPLLRRLPFHWLYPTGEAQEDIKPRWASWYQWAEVIAGDFLIIRRHLPARLPGKLILTNSTTPEDVELLRERGVRTLVTTSLMVEGRSFGTNVLEGILTVLADRPAAELRAEDLLALAERIGWQPTVIQLN
jgi:hypothetical protein